MPKKTLAQAINEALFQEMERDERVFVLGEDVARMGGDFGITRGLLEAFGEKRVRDTPLSEAALVGLGNGAAMVGLRPVVEIMFADFLTVCYDQLVNNAAKAHFMFNGQLKVPLVVRTACGGGFRAAYHHSQNVEAWFMNVPGLTIVAPSTAYDAKGLLLSSIREENPVLFLEHKLLYSLEGEVPEEEYTIPLGEAQVKREGKDVTIIATMKMVHEALEVAEELEEEGISVGVLDPRTLFPIDWETIYNQVAKTGRVVLVYEAPKTGGYGAELGARLAEEMFEFLQAPILRVTSKEAPVAFAPDLEDYALPSKEEILEGVREVLDY